MGRGKRLLATVTRNPWGRICHIMLWSDGRSVRKLVRTAKVIYSFFVVERLSCALRPFTLEVRNVRSCTVTILILSLDGDTPRALCPGLVHSRSSTEPSNRGDMMSSLIVSFVVFERQSMGERVRGGIYQPMHRVVASSIFPSPNRSCATRDETSRVRNERAQTWTR